MFSSNNKVRPLPSQKRKKKKKELFYWLIECFVYLSYDLIKANN